MAQRVYGPAQGYQDLNDHEQLAKDPLLAMLCGKKRVGEEALAGKSPWNGIELSVAAGEAQLIGLVRSVCRLAREYQR